MPRLIAATYPVRWTSITGALEGVLQALGAPLSPVDVSVRSGHAFRFALTATPDGAFGPDGPNSFSSGSALPLYEGLGRRFEAIETPAAASDRAKRRAEALKHIKKSVDRGRPAIVYGLHLPEFGIVRGYDGDDLIAATTVSPQYGERIRAAQWPAPGRPLPIRVFLPAKPLKIDRERAFDRLLRFAVRYARDGERDAPADGAVAVTGFAAFERWIVVLEGSEAISPHGHAYCIQALQAGRNDAAMLLRAESAKRPAVATPLAEAAAAYRAEVLELSRLATLFPYPNGGDISSTGSRRAGAAGVRRALAAEQAAVAALARAIG